MKEEANRWWFSWECYERDWRPVTWPMPEGWLGYWCSGSGENYSTLCGWAFAENEATLAEMLKESWPDWGGDWRIEPELMEDPPGGRFPLPSWSPLAQGPEDS